MNNHTPRKTATVFPNIKVGGEVIQREGERHAIKSVLVVLCVSETNTQNVQIEIEKNAPPAHSSNIEWCPLGSTCYSQFSKCPCTWCPQVPFFSIWTGIGNFSWTVAPSRIKSMIDVYFLKIQMTLSFLMKKIHFILYVFISLKKSFFRLLLDFCFICMILHAMFFVMVWLLFVSMMLLGLSEFNHTAQAKHINSFLIREKTLLLEKILF